MASVTGVPGMAAMAPPPMSAGMPAATASIASAGSAVASDSGLGVKLLGLGALGLAGYLFWFDRSRRSAPDFKEKLGDKRRAEKMAILRAKQRAQQAALMQQRAAQQQQMQAQGGRGGGMPSGMNPAQEAEIMQTIQVLHAKGMEKIQAGSASDDKLSIIAGLKLLIGAVNAAGQLPAGAAKVIADSILIRMKQGGFHTAAEMYTKALTGDPTWAQ